MFKNFVDLKVDITQDVLLLPIYALHWMLQNTFLSISLQQTVICFHKSLIWYRKITQDQLMYILNKAIFIHEVQIYLNIFILIYFILLYLSRKTSGKSQELIEDAAATTKISTCSYYHVIITKQYKGQNKTWWLFLYFQIFG